MDFSVFSNFDFSVFQWIQEHVWCAFLDAVMPVITVLGEGGWIWIVIAVLLLFMPKYRKAGVTMAFALILMLILNDGILKNIFVSELCDGCERQARTACQPAVELFVPLGAHLLVLCGGCGDPYQQKVESGYSRAHPRRAYRLFAQLPDGALPDRCAVRCADGHRLRLAGILPDRPLCVPAV